LNAPWSAAEVRSFALFDRRIGILDEANNLSVKDGPLNAPWSLEATGIQSFALFDDRIAILDVANSLSVKEGPLNAPWALWRQLEFSPFL
jgi:hypothetical protein